jgi:hypothetical protein
VRFRRSSLDITPSSGVVEGSDDRSIAYNAGMASARALSVGMLALFVGACGQSSGDDETEPHAGGSSSVGGSSNTGGSNTGGSNTGGSSSGGGSGTGGTSSTGGGTGGTSSRGGSSSTGGSGGAGGTAGQSSGGAGAGGRPADEGPGTITDTWSDFCVATFTEDYAVTDAFMKPLFTALTGERYLITYYPEPFSRAKLAYLTSTGPYEFDVEPNSDHTAFPFTTDCPNDLDAEKYFAVFTDVSVFAEPELTTRLCDLSAGTALPHDDASSAGYALEGVGTTSSIYEIYLNAFSAECGGAESGYISVPAIQLFGSAYVVVPFRLIPAPN